MRVKRLIIAASLANLLHMRMWVGLIGPIRTPSAFIRTYASPTQLFAVLISFLLASTLIWILLSLSGSARRWPRFAANGLLLGVVLTIGNFIRILLLPYVPVLRTSSLFHPHGMATAVTVLLVAGLPMVLYRFRATLGKCLLSAGLVASPAILVTLGQAMWATTTNLNSCPLDVPPPATPSARTSLPSTRVVWLVFDELDQALSFDARPPHISLPELDRMRGESFYASNAHPPAGDTVPSMVALITGRRVTQVRDLGPDRIEARFADGSLSADWPREPNMFSQARALGFNTGVVGWHLPYCSLFNQVLTECWWEDIPSVANSTNGGGLLRDSVEIFLGNFEGAHYGLFGPSLMVQRHAAMYRASTNRAIEMATDPKLDMVLLHLPGAHEPYINSRRSPRWDRNFSLPSGYPDELELVDRTLGEIRGAMTTAGVYDRTSIILTSDHWFRNADKLTGKLDKRVPFMVKLAGQNKPLSYLCPFNTLVTRDLVLEILRREITTPDELATWLDREPVTVAEHR